MSDDNLLEPDRQIAKEVFDFEFTEPSRRPYVSECHRCGRLSDDCEYSEARSCSYSEEIVAAWAVVNALRRDGHWSLEVEDRNRYGFDEFEVTFCSLRAGFMDGWATARTLPEAACRAALQALAGRGEG